jgi:23S rRNA (cytosine1962-C5)-methyltransferase
LDELVVDATAVISPAGARRLRQGHLWVYSADVVSEPENPATPIVRVVDAAGNLQGYALYSSQSQIRLRFLSRDSSPPTSQLFRNRLKAAIRRRADRLEAGTACRLVFGEADLLPSIVVDRYGQFLVLQTLSYGADALRSNLLMWLTEELQPAGVVERNDVKARRLEGLELRKGLLAGAVPERVEISEAGLRFQVDLLEGQKTGFFLDQRDNRIAAARYASGEALDCFTNTGAFALHFAAGCERVTAVDSSAESLSQGRANALLNGISNVEFLEANVFDLLREMDHAGRRFDLICLDPPAFAKNRGSLSAAKGGYKELNLRAMKLLRPEGVLVTSSCSFHLSEAMFLTLLQQAAHDVHRYVQVIERRGQSRDHPVLIGMPETHYLKCFVLRVL